ncbi:hypothetical protein PRIPAC_94511 [Pristionchus pacificus]|uniref:Uncharacterized protein n=1 Tax=Pristionchus pacificus TaxID=54126 RepID=A0A2A6BQG8_PRIPA|nr:hypothetical protein PRIPAC_94511 [Pristionchus pacificus]|eukprot:PDM68127.1 hypothetical protein PRIPAC_46171 [Pristionchus pacificus]
MQLSEQQVKMLFEKEIAAWAASSSSRRSQSAWVNLARSDADSNLSSSSKIDVEKQLTDEQVQRLLSQLTEMELEDKVFRTGFELAVFGYNYQTTEITKNDLPLRTKEIITRKGSNMITYYYLLDSRKIVL